MRVLVTGATGAFGPVAVDALRRDGNDVEIFRGRVQDRDAVHEAAKNVDAIVHLAAVVHKPKTPASVYQEVNVVGTHNVASSDKRVILASTIAVYGYNRGITLTEESSLQPDTEYGRSKVAAEEIVRRAEGTILRLGAVYGARVKGNYKTLVKALRFHLFPLIGDGANRRSVIYDEDAAAAIVTALHAKKEGTYNVVHAHTPTVKEIIDAICAALGRKPPRVRVPVRLAPAKYLEDVVVSPEKIRRELGFVARTDVSEGWAAALAPRTTSPV